MLAGNNELEVAIRSRWYPSAAYREPAQVADYLTLMRAAGEAVQSVFPEAIYLRSSPSNGSPDL